MSWLFIFVLGMDGDPHIVGVFLRNIHVDQGVVNLAHRPKQACHLFLEIKGY